MPTTPHWAAGQRIEPPVSVPSAPAARPAATATALPPLEPPVDSAGPSGFTAGGVSSRHASGDVRVEPSTSAPAWRSRATHAASASGVRTGGPIPNPVGRPATSTTSLTTTVTPASSPGSPPARATPSTRAASRSTPGASTAVRQCQRASSSATRSRAARARSAAASSPEATQTAVARTPAVSAAIDVPRGVEGRAGGVASAVELRIVQRREDAVEAGGRGVRRDRGAVPLFVGGEVREHAGEGVVRHRPVTVGHGAPERGVSVPRELSIHDGGTMDRPADPARSEADVAEAFAIADLVRRVAGDTGVHVYELEVSSPTDYVCVLWVGEALETLLGAIPDGLDPEQAWEACIHPDDLAAYQATVPELWAGRTTEVEYRLVGFNGITRWVWQRCRPRRRVDGRVIAEGIVSDITERRRAEDALHEARERLRHLAYHDGLTGLPNRLLLEERVAERIAQAARDGGVFPVLFVDLDGFKPLNDRYGHAVGDRVLQVVAERLRGMVRRDDAVARLGGDEFLVVGPCADDVADARSAATALAQRVRAALAEPFPEQGAPLVVTASVGAALYPVDGEDLPALLAAADHAMYDDKFRDRRTAA